MELSIIPEFLFLDAIGNEVLAYPDARRGIIGTDTIIMLAMGSFSDRVVRHAPHGSRDPPWSAAPRHPKRQLPAGRFPYGGGPGAVS